MKNGIKLFLFVLVGLVSLYVVSAQPYGADNVTVINSSSYNASGILPTLVYAQAGNVSQLEINGTAVTTAWQGFYGNITGKIVLADAGGNNFYDWNLTSPSGEVYASRSNAVTWANVNCSTTANVTVEETALGQVASDPDSITSTFTATDHPWFFVGGVNVTGCYSTHAYNSSGEQGTGFWQVLLNDDANTIYTTILDASPESGYNDNPWDFQLLVGENGKPGEEAATPYYFYVELQ